jgi:hypothetical protein
VLAKKAADMAKDGGALVTVEAGGSLWPRTPVGAGERDQRLAKAALIVDTWKLGGVDAVTLSEGDWAMGTDAVRAIVKDLPVLAANLVCGGDRPFPPSVVVERGGWKVGVVGTTAGKVDGCEVQPPLPAATAALAALPPVDVKVWLWPDAADKALEKDESVPADIVVDASGRSNERLVGGAWALSTGPRGKFVGMASISAGSGPLVAGDGAPVDGEVSRLEKQLADAHAKAETGNDKQKAAAQKRIPRLEGDLERARSRRDRWSAAMAGPHRSLSIEQIDLSPEVGEHEETMRRVLDALGKLGQDPAPEPRFVQAPSPFSGADTCTRCHEAEAQQWSKTEHARAWGTLVGQHRSMDAECFSCHATGVGQPGGPTTPAEVHGLRDVQCEACHGASRAHVADSRQKTSAVTESTCRQCHGTDRDEGRFDYATYLPKIVHAAASAPGR